MKGKNLLIAFGLALGLGFGAVAGLSARGVAEKAEATGGVISGGDTVYLRLSNDNWGSASADYCVYAFGGSADSKTFTPMTAVATDSLFSVYSAVIPENNDSIIFTRHKPGATPAWDDNKWNQSGDLLLSDSTSNLWAKADGDNWSGGSWATGTYSEAATNLSLTFYSAQTSEPTHCYAWDRSGALNGAYPGNEMATPSKATFFHDTLLYRQTLNYTTHMSDHSDVDLHMILSVGGDSDKSANIDIVTDGAYFYADGYHWYDGYVQSAELGTSAKVAWDLATVDICNLSASDADDLRDAMDAHESDLLSATWAGFTYEQAYELVDSQCTTPKLAVNNAFDAKNVNNAIIIVVIISVIAAASLILLISLKKKRHN